MLLIKIQDVHVSFKFRYFRVNSLQLGRIGRNFISYRTRTRRHLKRIYLKHYLCLSAMLQDFEADGQGRGFVKSEGA